ncbi:hypothetical protein ACTXT7_010972 [Hymenolepis weldensis]
MTHSALLTEYRLPDVVYRFARVTKGKRCPPLFRWTLASRGSCKCTRALQLKTYRDVTSASPAWRMEVDSALYIKTLNTFRLPGFRPLLLYSSAAHSSI